MKDSVNLKPLGDDREDDVVTRMRQTLEKMGDSRKTKKPFPKSRGNKGSSTKNHRFVRDGQVQVEKHALSRPPANKESSSSWHETSQDKNQLQQMVQKLKKRVALLQKQLGLIGDEHRRVQLHYNDLEALSMRQKKNLDKKDSQLQAERARITALEKRVRGSEEKVASLREELAGYKKKTQLRFNSQIAQPQEKHTSQLVKWWKD